MTEFFFDATFFLLATGVLLFLPGWFLIKLFCKNVSLNHWEFLTLSFGISVGVLDFLLIAIGTFGVRYSVHSITLSLFTFGITVFVVQKIFSAIRKNPKMEKNGQSSPVLHSKKERFLFLLILFLSIFVKTIYLSDAAFPTATDLGHHMFWAKKIAETGIFPAYEKQELTENPDGSVTLSPSEPIADFIIGEHLPFAAIAIFSGNDFVSAFPVSLLFIVHILALLAIFALALRIGEDMHALFSSNIFTPGRFALVILFLSGPLYSLASPQAKFVSGGVVGNTFGNFFIPLILLIFLRAIREKNPPLLAIGFFLIFTLAYTHHLSTLVLLFILVAVGITLLISQRRQLRKFFLDLWNTLRHPAPITIAILCIAFFFLIAVPTYLETKGSIDTAIGTPTKPTRTGLSFTQIVFSNGEARVALGATGLLLTTFLLFRKNTVSLALLFGWGGILLLMSLRPDLVFLDIPSNRIGSYALFPLSFLSGITLFALLSLFRERFGEKFVATFPHTLLLASLFLVFVFSTGSGSFDNGQTLLGKPKAEEAVETFTASAYLAKHSEDKDLILKDHNYLTADTWMKLFFLRDYNFPLSRSYFGRYETPGREQCTLQMISIPNTAEGKRCFETSGVNIIVVHPLYDRSQFEKSNNFSRIYSSNDIHIYEKSF